MPLWPSPNIITLGAHDLDGLRAFYARLGWEEAPVAAPGWASFEIGGALLTLFPFADHSGECARATPATAAAGSADGAFAGLTIALSVDYDEDVDMHLELARAAGATVLKEPEVAAWGARSAYFADPEGNVWEIACRPASAFEDAVARRPPDF